VYNNASDSYSRLHVTAGPRPERPSEQAQVARASNGDREAMELLVLANFPGVVHIAKEFRGRGVPFDDVIAEGCVGLLKAIRGYRAENGTRFMTYASFWVRKQILAAVADQPHAIHVPRYARQRGYSVPRVLRLDGPKNGDTDLSLGDRLAHPDLLPAEAIIEREQHVQVRRHVLRLPLRERAVIAWRFGLGGQAPQTLHEIGHRFGLSKERVRQIEVSALTQLRDALTKSKLPAPLRGPNFTKLWDGRHFHRSRYASVQSSSRSAAMESRARDRISRPSTRP